jgi:hypothetical protein
MISPGAYGRIVETASGKFRAYAIDSNVPNVVYLGTFDSQAEAEAAARSGKCSATTAQHRGVDGTGKRNYAPHTSAHFGAAVKASNQVVTGVLRSHLLF